MLVLVDVSSSSIFTKFDFYKVEFYHFLLFFVILAVLAGIKDRERLGKLRSAKIVILGLFLCIFRLFLTYKIL